VCDDPYSVPDELDQSCTGAEDCLVLFLAGYCGCSVTTVAYNRADEAAFAAHRASCSGDSTTICECPVPTVHASTGETIMPDTVVVDCVGGACFTRRDPDYCTGADECVSTYGECVATTGEPLNGQGCRDSRGECCYCSSCD
jgi:hypothetical protein